MLSSLISQPHQENLENIPLLQVPPHKYLRKKRAAGAPNVGVLQTIIAFSSTDIPENSIELLGVLRIFGIIGTQKTYFAANNSILAKLPAKTLAVSLSSSDPPLITLCSFQGAKHPGAHLLMGENSVAQHQECDCLMSSKNDKG
jgi:hypothetical protein